jgi:hypothetical protein
MRVVVMEVSIDGKTILICDPSKFSEVKENKCVIKLPELFPNNKNDDLFGFDYSYVSVSSHGCTSNASQLIEFWGEFENEIPLKDILEIFVVMDFLEYYSKDFTLFTPPWVYLLQLVDLLKSCENVNGLQHKIIDIKKSSTKLIRKFNKELEDNPTDWGSTYYKYSNELAEKITSLISELLVTRELVNYVNKKGLEKEITLMKKGPDIKINGTDTITLEVKRRIDQLLPWSLSDIRKGITQHEPISFSPQTLFLTICFSCFPELERAIDEQQAQIVFIDTSHIFSGIGTTVLNSLYELDLSFDKAVDSALNEVRDGKNVIVPFAMTAGKESKFNAMAVPYHIVKELGGRIDRIKRNDIGTLKPLEELINEINEIVVMLKK